MSCLRFCSLFALLISSSLMVLADTTPETIVIPIDNSTTAKPITTTTPPETTTVTPITTTAKTTTSTTSTTTPSTTSTSTTTSTPAPTTTPAPSPAPTPKPGPVPAPDQGTWSYTNTTANITCVVVQFAAQLNVTYPKNNSSLSTVLINVPANATVVDGSCTDDQWIKLSWSEPNATTDNSMLIVYHRNDTNKNYEVKSLNVTLAPSNFDNGSLGVPIVLYHGEAWQTPLATSYRCKVPSQLNMSCELTNVAATFMLSRLQEEAYRNVPGTGFSAARECGGGDVPDAVPIAVGCALGGLVVVVLIAYLVGRRRSAARGYLSM